MFAERLERLGADPAEIEAARQEWVENPPAPDEIEWVRHATDAELLHEIRTARAEFLEHTTLDGDEPETGGAPDEGPSPSDPLPDDVVRVDAIIEWVGGDPDRARTALDVEHSRSTQRSTLIETLQMVIRASAR